MPSLDLASMFRGGDAPQSRASLASAAWADRRTVERELSLRPGDFWLGRSDTEDAVPLGFSDDRHVCLTCGSRGGKGTSIIVNNLCGWPGSVVVLDPKGENATLTATRRGNGSAHAKGLGQKVFVLDPFAAAHVPDDYRATFNPLDALDEMDENVTILAGEIANAMVVQSPDAKDSKFFDESARAMLKALILHVRTSPWVNEEERNLLMVRRLLMRGAWRDVEAVKLQQIKLPKGEKKRIPSAQVLLWKQVKQNQACNGILYDYGSTFGDLLVNAPETYESARQTARTNTDFIEDAAMQRQLEASTPGLALSVLKDEEKGASLYLSLPDDYRDTHSRWLRLIITLIIGSCRKLDYQPKSGHSVLMVLDEFAGLQRMPIIENAVDKMASYGLKLFFVLQSLEQLKSVYPDRWQTFLANCGVSIFFGLNRLDLFTCEHVSKAIGDTEIVRVTRSITVSKGVTVTKGETFTVGQSLSISRNTGVSQARQRGWSNSQGDTITRGKQGGTNRTGTSGISGGESTHWGETTGLAVQTGTSQNSSSGPGGSTSGSGSNESKSLSLSSTVGGGRNTGWSQSTSDGVSEGWSDAVGRSMTGGETGGTSDTVSSGTANSEGRSYSQARSLSRSMTETTALGFTETLHVRPLLQPGEMTIRLRRVNDDETSAPSLPDYRNAAYPGLALVLMDGENPFLVRRANYYEDPCFLGFFEQHPHHKPKETRLVDVDLQMLRPHFGLREESLKVEWCVAPNDRVLRGETIAYLSASHKPEPRMPIVAVNDGIVSGMSCPDGEYGPKEIVTYQLLTSERTPRPDIGASDLVPEKAGKRTRRWNAAYVVKVCLAIVAAIGLFSVFALHGFDVATVLATVIGLLVLAVAVLIAAWFGEGRKAS